MELLDILLHPVCTDVLSNFDVVPNSGIFHRRAKCMVLPPMNVGSSGRASFAWISLTVPTDDKVGVSNHAGFQTDQRIRNFESRCRSESAAAARLVVPYV